MNAQLQAYTVINTDCYSVSDLDRLNQHTGTDPEAIIEYAGRVCYHSTANMGHNPDFIAARVKEGHFDIVEHAWATCHVRSDHERFFEWHRYNPYIEVEPHRVDGLAGCLVSANLRAWYDFLRFMYPAPAEWGDVPNKRPAAMAQELRKVAPSIFGQSDTKLYRIGDPMAVPPMHDGQRTVTLVGHTCPLLTGNLGLLRHSAATFLVEGISRTASHQLVRHRRLSFSQLSQRYTDPEKTRLQTVMPPSIAVNPAYAILVNVHYEQATKLYRELREAGVRKEDARFVLPEASETRLVVSGNFPAWYHFLKLRLDKAAQWEIRAVAEMVRTALWQLEPNYFAPDEF